ncbi:leucine-rich repeat-containing protein 24-like isoform X1 [Syngnathus typhle]|uniref:leucine-rich repeat-containing protein 24-like isoform X1 n=2 Tax=Syngnathus typhle TaxID=161592 RepID=UPI002A6B52E4|nr:leucine-rich repeat-containing protein 24-like isoform X1 [Syngnathus typhle]
MKARRPPSLPPSSSAERVVMPLPLPCPAARLPLLLTVVLLLSLGPPHATALGASASCPAGCRCYSLTVECGSANLLAFPMHMPTPAQTLFLQDNAIGQIRRQDLSPLAHLRYLYLQNNSISAVEPGSFQSQAQLLELALDGNRIRSVTADTFRGLRHLRILYLAANHIARLLDFTFRGLQRLQELHLQHNGVEAVGDQALAGLTSLALLDLSGNRLHTLAAAALRPLLSLQVLRVTENPWRCDCALHWLRSWMDDEGRRLLSSSERRRLRCREPPRLSRLGLLEVPPNSLVCIPPLVQLEPRRMAVRLGDSLRVSCHASGYPRPQVTWRKASSDKASPPVPRGLVHDLGGGARGVGSGTEPSEGGRAHVQKSDESALHFDPDTGSGMLFLSNVTVAHAGVYECEAWNAGGTVRVTFQLAINSSSSSIWAGWAQAAPLDTPVWPRLRSGGGEVSQEPLYALGSMAFGALAAATQMAIAAGISLLVLTALLLVAMIYSRRLREHKDQHAANKEESILYLNDYSDGPTTFAQLEEFRDERGHEMFVLNRAKPVLPPALPAAPPDAAGPSGSLATGPPPSPSLPPAEADSDIQTALRIAGEGGEAEPVMMPEGEGVFVNHAGLFVDSLTAYEIHC